MLPGNWGNIFQQRRNLPENFSSKEFRTATASSSFLIISAVAHVVCSHQGPPKKKEGSAKKLKEKNEGSVTNSPASSGSGSSNSHSWARLYQKVALQQEASITWSQLSGHAYVGELR